MSNFIDLLLKGDESILNIDKWVDDWHEGDSDVGLHEYLGMTWGEYVLWITKPMEYYRVQLKDKINEL